MLSTERFVQPSEGKVSATPDSVSRPAGLMLAYKIQFWGEREEVFWYSKGLISW